MKRFIEETERKGTKSVKWDMVEQIYQSKDVLPMWVADMDFKAPDAVNQALRNRIEHGIYGYTIPDAPVKEQIVEWLERNFNWSIDSEWITFSPGVIPSLHMIVQSLTNTGDGVLIQTPVYPPFYSVIRDHERQLVKNPLKLIGDRYEIDFDDFESKIKDENVSLFILCNPHNPVGRVWTKEELAKMGNLCLKHNVKIVSDEIHADLTFSGNSHIPMASISDGINNQTVTCYSPTKTFNLAGLQVSYLITANEKIKKQVNQQFKSQGIVMLNTLGITALEAAYQYGGEWLEELKEVLEENRDYVTTRLHKETDNLRVIPAEGTYLLWIDCRDLNLNHSELKSFMQKQAKVALNDGASFGEEGKGFMRINIATPISIIEEGVNRIIQATQTLP